MEDNQCCISDCMWFDKTLASVAESIYADKPRKEAYNTSWQLKSESYQLELNYNGTKTVGNIRKLSYQLIHNDLSLMCWIKII